MVYKPFSTSPKFNKNITWEAFGENNRRIWKSPNTKKLELNIPFDEFKEFFSGSSEDVFK
jgi:hypothetical protein